MNKSELFTLNEALKEVGLHTSEKWDINEFLSLFIFNKIELVCYANNIKLHGNLTGIDMNDDFPEETEAASDDYQSTAEAIPDPFNWTGYFYLSQSSFEEWGSDPDDFGISRYVAKDCIRRLIDISKEGKKLKKKPLNKIVVNGEGEMIVDGYFPSINNLYVTKVSLLLLIESIQLENDNQYVWISNAAGMMMQKQEPEKYKKLRDSFGFVTAPKYQERIIHAVQQGFIPQWRTSINGHWESSYNKEVYPTSLVMLEDINQCFRTDLRIDNLLTREIIKNSYEYKDVKGSAYKSGVIAIFNYITIIRSDYDFSEFSGTDLVNKGVSSKRQIFKEVSPKNSKNKEVSFVTFERDYWQKAASVLVSVAKREKIKKINK